MNAHPDPQELLALGGRYAAVVARDEGAEINA